MTVYFMRLIHHASYMQTNSHHTSPITMYLHIIQVQTKWELGGDALYTLIVEVKVPIEALIMHSDVPIDIEDEREASAYIFTR